MPRDEYLNRIKVFSQGVNVFLNELNVFVLAAHRCPVFKNF